MAAFIFTLLVVGAAIAIYAIIIIAMDTPARQTAERAEIRDAVTELFNN